MTSLKLFGFGALAAALFLAGWWVNGWRWQNKLDAVMAAQQESVIAAQKRAIVAQQSQTAINNEASHDFAKDYTNITALYASPDRMYTNPATPGDRLPALPAATGRACPAARPASRVYHLTFQQCDVEEAKLIALYNDWQEQAK